jgi:hypothetical protein
MHSLGLEGSQLVTALFGFNLGIETAQLVVVALVMPSLWVLSTTRFGAPVRIAGAAFALLAATGWILERAGAITSSPLNGAVNAIVAEPFVTAAALALLALVAGWRARPSPARALT